MKLSYNTPSTMYTVTNAAKIKIGSFESEFKNAAAVPWNEVKRQRNHRKLALMIYRQRRRARLKARERAQGHLRSVGGMDVNIFQRIWILLKLWIDFHDHVVLIQLREDCGDLSLPEGVVQGVVDIRRKNAQARRGVGIDGQR